MEQPLPLHDSNTFGFTKTFWQIQGHFVYQADFLFIKFFSTSFISNLVKYF